MRAEARPITALSLWMVFTIGLGPAGAVAHAAATTRDATTRPAFPGIVVVKMHTALPKAATRSLGVANVDAALVRHSVTSVQPVRRSAAAPRKRGRTDLGRWAYVRYAGVTPPAAVAAQLAALPDVEYAEPLFECRIAATPNDPSFSSQSQYMNRMHYPAAWDVTKGEQGGVVIAIVDGGTDWRHPDLMANIYTNPGEVDGNGMDDDMNGYVDDVHGWNFANDTNDPTGLPETPNNAAHGTHTAGIACAVANNATGIAGASWNARLLPVDVGAPGAMNDQVIAFGYDGLLYAADAGADVVNLSWGGVGSPSNFEQEVVNYAWEQGSVVVAAAGNQNGFVEHFPSAYDHVTAVANVTNFDVRVSSSNFGTWVDVSAQGQSILSTFPGGMYGGLTGTSMSSPHTAALCALVKTRWPGYTPDQVAERVRVTSDNIDNVNPSRRGLLGYGRINAEQALKKNTPAIRVTGVTQTDTDGDGVVEPGETVTLQLTVTNFLAACTGVTFKLRETSAQASAGDSVATLGSLDSLGSAALPPLTLVISPTAPVMTRVNCILRIDTAAPVYADNNRFAITVLPTFANHDLNNVHTTVTSVGKLGFAVVPGGNGQDGLGFTFAGSGNLLYEGALILGTGPTAISNAARGANPQSAAADNDFATLPNGVPKLSEPGVWAPEQSVAAFNDSLSNTPVRVALRQDTYAYPGPVHDDYVILRYTIRNTSGAAVMGLRIGWFCDWDVDGGTFTTNRTGFDPGRDLGYVYDDGVGPEAYVGIQVLNAAGATSYRGIWNDNTAPGNPSWGLFDGYTDQEKWESLSAGVVFTDAGPADISNAIATGPFDLAPGDSVEVGFAFLGGENLADLQGNADAAALKWQHLHSGVPVTITDFTAALDAGDVVLRWRTEREADVAAFRVYRARDGGAFEALAPDLEPEPAQAYAFRDPGPAPGRYTYRIGEVAPDGGVTLHAGVEIDVPAAGLPLHTYMDGAVPNPFNPSTTLRFGLARPGGVHLDVFDARGRQVRTLVAGALPAGHHRVVWDGRDDTGRRVASGVYHARLDAAGSRVTQRLVLLQ